MLWLLHEEVTVCEICIKNVWKNMHKEKKENKDGPYSVYHSILQPMRSPPSHSKFLQDPDSTLEQFTSSYMNPEDCRHIQIAAKDSSILGLQLNFLFNSKPLWLTMLFLIVLNKPM